MANIPTIDEVAIVKMLEATEDHLRAEIVWLNANNHWEKRDPQAWLLRRAEMFTNCECWQRRMYLGDRQWKIICKAVDNVLAEAVVVNSGLPSRLIAPDSVMPNDFAVSAPRTLLMIVAFLAEPELRDDRLINTEGRYEKDVVKFGEKTARWLLVRDILGSLVPNVLAKIKSVLKFVVAGSILERILSKWM